MMRVDGPHATAEGEKWSESYARKRKAEAIGVREAVISVLLLVAFLTFFLLIDHWLPQGG